jgi:hypothetical protein
MWIHFDSQFVRGWIIGIAAARTGRGAASA